MILKLKSVDIGELLKSVELSFSRRHLSIAVIGFGKMGLLHSAILNLLNPKAVKYVIDKSFVVRLGGRLMLKEIKFLRKLEDLVNSKEDVDAVYVTTPVGSHYFLAKKLLEVGFKHIFIEKPPVLDLKQFEELLDLSRRAFVMVGFQKRFSLPLRHAKLLLERDVVGDLRRVECSIKSGDIVEMTEKYEKLGRGVLLDLGIHVLDLLNWFLGEKPSVVTARYKSAYSGVDDYFKAVLSLGAIEIDFETTWSDPTYRLPETYFKFEGSEGTIVASDDFLKVYLRDSVLGEDLSEISLYRPHYYRGFPPVLVADPEFTVEDMHFLSTLENRHRPLSDLESSYNTMLLVEELYRAASRG